MSKAIFPNFVINTKRGYFPTSIVVPQMEMDGINNKRGDFWREQMEDRNKQVLDRATQIRSFKKVYDVGGTQKGLPKPQPTGSFNAPFYNYSGNDGYGEQMRGGGTINEVRVGHELSQKLLQKRAEQLDNLEEVESGILKPAPTEEKVKEDSSAMNQIELLMSNIMESSVGGKLDDLKLEELRKLVNALAKYGLDLSLNKLQRYKQILREVALEVEDYFLRKGEIPRIAEGRDEAYTKEEELALRRQLSYDLNQYERALPVFNLIFKSLSIVDALIDNFNMSEGDREINFRTRVKAIIKARPLKSISDLSRPAVERLLQGKERRRDEKGEELKAPMGQASAQRRAELQRDLDELTPEEREEFIKATKDLRGKFGDSDGYVNSRDFFNVRKPFFTQIHGVNREDVETDDEDEEEPQGQGLAQVPADVPAPDLLAIPASVPEPPTTAEFVRLMEGELEAPQPKVTDPQPTPAPKVQLVDVLEAKQEGNEVRNEVNRLFDVREAQGDRLLMEAEQPFLIQPQLQAKLDKQRQRRMKGQGRIDDGHGKMEEEKRNKDDGLFRAQGRLDRREIQKQEEPELFTHDLLFDDYDMMDL